MIVSLDPVTADRLREKIFAFYHANRRDFPWRNTTDRYAVMVSEIMLQQTQAERVVPRFLEWMDRFPDVRALASASLREALALWSGLGYNARGQRLRQAAIDVTERFGGVMPGEPAQLLTLPGIGPYTSCSIPVFADNRDLAAVDTNVRRVLIHELTLDEQLPMTELRRLARELLPEGRSRDWHNALMDYGALELTSRRTGISPHSRQSSFKGSRRWYRGQLLKALVAEAELPVSLLEDRYPDCPYGISAIIGALVGEGLAEWRDSGRSVAIAGEGGGDG